MNAVRSYLKRHDRRDETVKLLGFIQDGDIEGCKRYIQGSDLCYAVPGFYPPLLEAVCGGNRDIVLLLLQHCAPINVQVRHKHREKTTTSPLMLAVENNDHEMVKFLLHHGSDVLQIYKKKQTVLHVAAEQGDGKCVKALLQNSDKTVQLIETLNKKYVSPLDLAWKVGNAEIIMMFIVHGATSTPYQRQKAFEFGMEQMVDDYPLWKIFIENYVDITDRYHNQHTCLHLAVKHNSMTVLYLLLTGAAQVMVNVWDTSNQTPLHMAVEEKKMDAILLLLDANADRSLKDMNGNTCLHLAIKAQDEDIIWKLAKDEDLTKTYVIDEFIYACKTELLDVLNILIKLGFDCNARYGANEETPLHVVAAQQAGSVEVIKLLVDRGADKRSVRKDGATVLHAALESGVRSVVEEVLSWNLDVEATNALGHSVLHTLVNSKSKHDHSVHVSDDTREWIAIELIDRGCPVHAFDHSGKSALWNALQSGDDTATEVLLQHCTEAQALDSNNSTLIHSLVLYNNVLLDKLINNEKIKDLEAKTSDGDTPLILAILQQKPEAVRILVKHKADVLVRKDGSTVLHLLLSLPSDVAVESALEEMLKREDIKELLEEKDSAGNVPIQLAFQESRQNCIEQLTAAGANVPDVWIFDFSALILASDAEAIRKKLSKYDIDLAASKPDPLCFALENIIDEEPIEVCKAFLDKGSNVDIRVKMKGTKDHLYQHAINHAAVGETWLMDLLLKYARDHVDLSMPFTIGGDTLLHRCFTSALPSTSKMSTIIEQILASAAVSQLPDLVNIRNKRGETPLWSLLSNQFADAVTLVVLLQYGADPNTRSLDTSTFPCTSPLELALMNGDPDLCRLLILAGADPEGLPETIETPVGAVTISQPGTSSALLAMRPERPRTDLRMLLESNSLSSLGLTDEYFTNNISPRHNPEQGAQSGMRAGGNAGSRQYTTGYTRSGVGTCSGGGTGYQGYHHDDWEDYGTDNSCSGGGGSGWSSGGGGDSGWSSGGGGDSGWSSGGGGDSGWSSGGGGGGCTGGDGGGGDW